MVANHPIEIRKAVETDAEALSQLGRSTYAETYGAFLKAESVALHLANTYTPEIQRAEIKDPRRRIEIAWSGSEAIGYLQLFEETPPACVPGEKPLKLQRLYVDKKWHGRKVGALLMDRGLAIAHAEDFKTMWLSVWQKNPRAQAFYRKYAFTIVGTELFKVGDLFEKNDLLARAL